MVNKRGQFFIMAAVILSVIIFALAATTNYARVNKTPDRFYDLSRDVQSEGARVIDYGIYSNSDVKQKVANFTANVSNYMLDSDPNMEFVFVYGNKTNITIENYGKDETSFKIGSDIASVGGGGKEIRNNIGIVFPDATIGDPTFGSAKNYNRGWIKYITPAPNADMVQVKINEKFYNFSLKENQQFIIIAQKQQLNETYVDIK